jgi:hypothetical protein
MREALLPGAFDENDQRELLEPTASVTVRPLLGVLRIIGPASWFLEPIVLALAIPLPLVPAPLIPARRRQMVGHIRYRIGQG